MRACRLQYFWFVTCITLPTTLLIFLCVLPLLRCSRVVAGVGGGGESGSLNVNSTPPTIGGNKSYRILIFSPSYSRSHLISNSRIADALAEAGHNVTLLQVEWFVRAPFTSFSTRATELVVTGHFSADDEPMDDSWVTRKAFSRLEEWSIYHLVFNLLQYRGFQEFNDGICTRVLDTHGALFRRLREERFDIYFGEQHTLCGTGLSHLLGIPMHFWVSSTPLFDYLGWLVGVPSAPSYVPPAIESSFSSDQLSYWGRVVTLAEYTGLVSSWLASVDRTTALFRQHYGADFPHLGEIARESPLVFVNTHELVDFPRPTLHNVIHIGGLGMPQIKLPGNGEASEEATNLVPKAIAGEYSKGRLGVVYCSFGTIVSTRVMPPAFLTNLLAAFGHFAADFHFIVKVDDVGVLRESHPHLPIAPNIHLAEWVPQAELLAGGRVRAFITHGGYNSVMEAAVNGVPLVGMGIFFDQLRNVRLAERNGWAVAFDQRQLLSDPAPLVAVLERVLYTNASHFAGNAKRIRRLLANAPLGASQRLVRWVELVAGAGEGRLPELQPAGRHLPLVVYYNLDIIVPLAIASVAVLIGGIFLAARMTVWVLHWAMRSWRRVVSKERRGSEDWRVKYSRKEHQRKSDKAD